MATQDKWNGWDLEDGLLSYELGDRYEIPIYECTSSAVVLGWIAQVAEKTWAHDSCLAGLGARDGRDLDLRSTLCGGGQNRKLSKTEVREIVDRAEKDIERQWRERPGIRL